MAINYFTKFAGTDLNALSDEDLQTYLTSGEGIAYNAVAFSNILNGLFRQTSSISRTVAQFITDQSSTDVKSDADAMDDDAFIDALDAWVTLKGFALDSDMPFEKSTAIAPTQPLKLQIWWGTQAEYELLTPNNNTLYYILE